IYENIPVEFSINSFFASHIGIFGNTGSGKSNTIARLYYELFKTIDANKIGTKSKFHLFDFNGEYAHKGVFGLGDSDINIINLSTISDNNEDKLEISSEYFYSPEILSVLFGATEQTQKPFIKRLLSRMEYANENGWGIQ